MKSFYSVLRTDLHRAFCSKGFLVGIAATVCVFFFGSVGMGLASPNVSAGAMLNNTYKSNNIIRLLFLTSTFAYSASYSVDLQTRFILPLLARRGNKNSYLISKCVAAALSGGLAVALGAVIFIIYACMAQPSVMPTAEVVSISFETHAFAEFMSNDHAALFFMCFIYVIFLQAAFFSSLGLLVSCFKPNRFVAYIGPFSIGFLLNQLAPLFGLPLWLDINYLAAVRFYRTPASQILLIETAAFLSFTVIACAVFVHSAKRRIVNA
jgi:hypothetical protein